MGNILTPATVEIYLCNPEGVRLECLDYITEYQYIKIANDLSPFYFQVPQKFSRNLAKLDNIVEIWRGFGPGTLKLDYCGFLRAWNFGDNAGVEYTELYGMSSMELLKRRIVMNYEGSAQADMTDQADDMIKAITKDQMGSDASVYRDLTSTGGGFTIQADLSDGASITKAFSYKNVLEICQEIAAASAQAGTEVYFDIVPLISSSVTGALAFQLQTFTGQRGNDRTWNSNQPIFVGNEWGNFQNGNMEFDYLEEINYAYVVGQGVGASRQYLAQGDSDRYHASIWNWREGTRDARHVPYGESLDDEQRTFLTENKPKFRFGGEIVETPAFRYGRDWGFGDRMTAIYADIQKDAMIKKVQISRDSSGQETITAKLEVEE